MPGPVVGPQHHVPGLHGRAQEDQTFGVATQSSRVREVVGAIRRSGSMRSGCYRSGTKKIK